MSRSATSAAFFDLDRTLLRGASGPLITEALQAGGLVRDIRVPLLDGVYKFYELFGETLAGMALARRGINMADGWATDAVSDAAHDAADRIAPLIQPYAREVIDEHRSAGRPVVLATTTPRAFVEPLAKRLGFDAVVATDIGSANGVFTGAIESGLVWFRGKLNAIRAWADANSVDVGASWAYSDSIYDLPMLMAVQHPVAVNPDPRLRAVATLRRWKVVHLDVPPGVPKVAGLEPFDLLRFGLRPELLRFARFRFEGVENLPSSGGVIVASNHRSYFDPFAVGFAVAKRGRNVRFMAKREVTDAPVVGAVVNALGTIRVDRGSGSDQPLVDAQRALRAGEVVSIFPQGTIPRGEAFDDPVLQGKTGAARLAKSAGVSVIPMGVMGTEHVWPRQAKVPNLVNVLNPPAVVVRVGEPVALGGRSMPADTKRIMAAISELLR